MRLLINWLQMYSRLVDKCFNDCIDDFTSKSVSSREEGCVMRCWDKNMKAQVRLKKEFAQGKYRFNDSIGAYSTSIRRGKRRNDGIRTATTVTPSTTIQLFSPASIYILACLSENVVCSQNCDVGVSYRSVNRCHGLLFL